MATNKTAISKNFSPMRPDDIQQSDCNPPCYEHRGGNHCHKDLHYDQDYVKKPDNGKCHNTKLGHHTYHKSKATIMTGCHGLHDPAVLTL